MANRYWVGGTGTWNTTSTTNWSASSGGAPGASVPTAADSVFFDQASTYTVTMTGALTCLDITVSAGTVTFATGTGPTLAISGSMSLVAGTVWTATGALTFNATTTGKTITTNGVSFAANMTFNGAGGVWTLGSALTTSGIITITAGTLNTSAAGNYALSVNTFTCNSASTSALTLNASTVTVTGAAVTFSGTGFTLNAGTSQLNCTNSTINGGTTGRTLYNVSISVTTGAGIVGPNTFNNLSFTAPTSDSVGNVSIADNQTINGTFTGSGATEVRRLFYRSSALGATRTLTLANPATISNADFRDITAATNAITATSGGGNCGGNTNITFPAAKTVYWNLAGAQNWSAVGWAATSGGSPAIANFPLAQDTAVFNNAGSVTGTITIQSGGSWVWNIGTIDMSARTNAMTLTVQIINVLGNWITGTGVTQTGNQAVNFIGRGNTQTINTNGVTFTNSIVFQNLGGTVRLLSAVTTSSVGTVNLLLGTADLNGFTLTCPSFTSNNSNTRTLAFGSGNITVNGSSAVWTMTNVTGLTVTGTPTVNVSNATATATTVNPGALTEANAINFNFTTGTYSLSFLDSSGLTAGSVNFTGFSGTWAATNVVTIYGSLTLSTGMTLTASANVMTFGSTSGTTRIITTNGKTVDWPLTFNGVGGSWRLADALTMGSTRNFAHANGTVDLNGKTLTVGATYITGVGTKNLTFNGGTLVCPTTSVTAFNNAQPTNFTTTAGTGTGTISMTAALPKTFVGGGSTFNCTLNQGGAGALTITGANSFNNITNTVQPATITFPASTTTTVQNFSVSGTAGNVIIINSSSTGTQATLSDASGTIACDYLFIRDSAATGGASWYAGANSTNLSNNTGWVFTAPPAPGGNTGAFFSIL